jgi:Cof subfamily protein (haloacid dehalogenase superfamily)
MKYRMFACDLDGTLLNDGAQISKNNLEHIRYAKQSGVPVVITTGRSYAKAKKYIGEIDTGDPAVVFTGAAIYQDDKILRVTPLKNELIHDVLKLLKDMDYSPIVYPADNNKYYESFGSYREEYSSFSKSFDGSLIKVDNLMKRPWENVIRISVIGSEYDMQLLHRVTKQRFGGSVTSVDTYFPAAGVSIFEVLDSSSSKSKALDFLCRRLNISQEEVIACGDNNNDIDMLRWAGLGICMKNGMRDAVRTADYVTHHDNNDDGVSEAIEKFILNS